MRTLLDTSTFFWFIGGSRKFSEKALEIIENFDNELVMSAASLWKIAIKASIGKLELAEPFEHLIPKEINKNEIEILQGEGKKWYKRIKELCQTFNFNV